MTQHPAVEAVAYADNIYLVAALTRAHDAFDALAASMAKNMSLAVSTSQSYIYLPWRDEADWRDKQATYDAIKLLRDLQGKTTLPLVKDGFTCLGTHIGSADFRQACFRQTERRTQDLLMRMRPLTDNKLHTLMLTHNVTSKFIHSLRTSLPDDTSIDHFQQLDQHIQDAFLDRAVPGWRDSLTHSDENLRCMAQQPPSDPQLAGFGIGGLADSFRAHYYVTILQCLRDFHDTAGGRLRAAIQKHTTADNVLAGDLPSVQAAYEAERLLQAAGAQAAPLQPGQAPAAHKPLLPEILALFSSPTPIPSSSVLTAFARAAAQKVRIAALPPDCLRAMEVNRKPSDVAIAAPASSNSLFKGDRPRSHRQASGARGGRGGDQRPAEEKIKILCNGLAS